MRAQLLAGLDHAPEAADALVELHLQRGRSATAFSDPIFRAGSPPVRPRSRTHRGGNLPKPPINMLT